MRVSFKHDNWSVNLIGFDGDHITKQIAQTRDFYEVALLNNVAELAPTGTVVDIGANIGNHSVFFGLFTPARRVVAIEPYQPAYEVLEENIALNGLKGRVIPKKCAIGSENGRVGLLPGPESNLGHTKVVNGDEVDQVRLDDLLGEEEISILKIDVEGYEPQVLAGAMNILSNQHPHLYIEALRRRNKQKLDDVLVPLGYEAIQCFGRAHTYAYAPLPVLES